MKLAKWQGLGNDYLIVEKSALPEPLTPTAVGLLCDRHVGVGSDGILLHEEPTGAVPGAVARMRVFNPDGSESEMCGNGIRMFARYLVSEGATAGPEFVVETLAGAVTPLLQEDCMVRVDMGRARFRSANILPAAKEAVSSSVSADEDVVDAKLEVGGREHRFTFVDVGNPHCVIFVEDVEGFDVAGVGGAIERYPRFPNRTNVEFVKVGADGSVHMRVWERGVGETRACGTGATAVGAACVRLGQATSPVLVHLIGGDLVIEVEAAEDDGRSAGTGKHGRSTTASGRGLRVFMTGPAEEVFTGRLSNDLLRRLGWPASTTY